MASGSLLDIDLPIARPPAAVWKALTDWKSAPEWFGGGVDQGAGPKGGMRDLAMVTLHVGGKAQDHSIQDYEVGRSFALVWAERGVMVLRRYALKRSPEGNTVVSLKVDVDTVGLGFLFRRGVARRVAESDREQLDRLRAHVEGA